MPPAGSRSRTTMAPARSSTSRRRFARRTGFQRTRSRTTPAPAPNPGTTCVYWRYGEYAGVGPGAHGRLVTPAGRLATATERQPETWLERVERDGHGLVEEELLSTEAEGDEFLLMGLRLREGVDAGRYRALAGKDLDRGRIRNLEHQGFLAPAQAGRLAVTRAGFPVLNAVVADLAA